MVKPERYPLFDVFRLLLALEVVRGHMRPPEMFPAVAGFLAISGFLVPQSYVASRSFWHFAWKRFLRVTPGLVAMILAVGLYKGFDKSREMINFYIRFGFARSSWNPSLWSLPFEEVFYLLLAVLFMFGAYRRKWPIFVLAGIGFIICMMGWLYLPLAYAPISVPRTLPLFWAFFFGNVMWMYKEHLAPFRWLGFGLLMFAYIAQDRDGGFSLSGLFMAPAVILIGSQFKPRLPKIPDLSFGLYIIHMPVTMIITYSAPLAFEVSLALSAVSWFLIEKPALSLKDWSVFRKAEVEAVPAAVTP